MFDKAAKLPITARFLRKATDFRSDERGAIAIFVLIIFVTMLLVGGIAVDVMRAEMRRVTYTQTFDRAVLAAANISLPPGQSPITVGQSWYDVAGLGDEFTVDYGAPVFTGTATSSSREARAVGSVRSYNHFMHMLGVPYFNMPVRSAAQQGVSKIEVMLVLDITGSMAESSGSTTKIEALRTAATNFVNILKFNRDAGGNYTIPKDPNNLISIGMVPYATNVNIPVALRNQFNATRISAWTGGAVPGLADATCMEIPTSTYGSTSLSTTLAIPMMAVADPVPRATSPTTSTNTFGGSVSLGFASPTLGGASGSLPYLQNGWVPCVNGDNPNTAASEAGSNRLVLPTTDPATLTNQIAQLEPLGATSIAVGMRWGTALIDEAARPIYSNLLGGVPGMAGRPANNSDNETRKIIVVMTDGNHFVAKHVRDEFKSGLSPIWRGDDGNFAIRYVAGGPALTGGVRGFAAPNTCSGWPVAAARQFFVPHLKANSVRRRVNATEPEGVGTGTNVTGGCDPRAWVAPVSGAPTWAGSGTVRQLDWSEVWRLVRVDWVVRQLYMRSGVAGTVNYDTVYNMFVGDYLTSNANMDALLEQNCTAAKNAGVEVFGIVLGDSVNEGPVRNCSSPGSGYYYRVLTGDSLNAAFEQIAVLISDLRLTQ